MPESAVSDPLDVGFVRVIRKFYRRRRKRNEQEKEVIMECEEREYDRRAQRGQFQLWVDGKYMRNITSEIMDRRTREQYVIAWLDDKPPELPKSDSQKRGGIEGRKARVGALLNQLAEFT